jgi:hypothetical protein
MGLLMPINIPVNTPSTSARVDFVITNNATFQDAMIFGVAGDTSWNLTGQNFRMDIKADPFGASLLTLLSSAGQIVVDDPVQRIINFNVPESVIQANLQVGEYRYDFIMFDNSVPPVRVQLMHGKVKVKLGITGG